MTDSSGPASSDGLAPVEEEALIERMLREQAGIDPYSAASVLDLVAVACVNGGWRNTIVEDWHAKGRLHDGEMLRINAYSTWWVRQIITRWQRETELPPYLDDLDASEIAIDDVAWLASRIWRWLTNPARMLPTGVALADLAGNDLEEYTDEANRAMGGLAAVAEERGARFALWRSAIHAGLACSHWWLTPTWPDIVNRFMIALSDPVDPQWRGSQTGRVALMARYPLERDRESFCKTLLRQPWSLESEAAASVVDAGIGFFRRSSSLPASGAE